MVGITAPPAHQIELDGAENVRDIGGYPTLGGMRIRRETVYRADALNELSRADVQRLSRLGLRSVIDLRSDEEWEVNGPDLLPARVKVHRVPIRLGDVAAFYALIDGGDTEAQREALGPGRAEQAMLAMYRGFVTERLHRMRFGEAFRFLTDEDNLPALVHSTAGSDRVGWFCAVVMSILGVQRDLIVRDYLISNDMHQHSNELLYRSLADSGRMKEPFLLRPVLRQSQEYLRAGFEATERRYNSVSQYIRSGFDLDDGRILKLRQLLLEPDPGQMRPRLVK